MTEASKVNYHNALESITYPIMDLKALSFAYSVADTAAEKDHALQKLLALINENEMAVYYKHLCSVLAMPLNTQLLADLEHKNTSKIAELELRLKDAQENLGDIDILECLTDAVIYYSKIADVPKALHAIKLLCDREVSSGIKIDLGLLKIRLGLLYDKMDLVAQSLAVAKHFVDACGDWDRRNKVKIYEGMVLFYTGKFKDAAVLLHSCIATFVSSELLSYKDFVRYTIIAAAEGFTRPELKCRIIDNSEINEVISQLPLYCKYVDSFYCCRYAEFIRALMELGDSLKTDCYASRHRYHLLREMTYKAYSQILQSYSSLSLEAMARAFNVSVQFIEKEISFWIARGRLCCAIDKSRGLVEVYRAENRSLQYSKYVERCEALTTKIQKLVRNVKV